MSICKFQIIRVKTIDNKHMSISIKRPEPVKDDANPFGDDKLSRRDLADSLTALISDSEEPLVIALNGGWGTGKTFFLERWMSLYSQNMGSGNAKLKPFILSFNAWQDDDLDDPLLAVVGQLHHYLHARKSNDPAITEDFKSKAERCYNCANQVLSKTTKHLSHILEHFTGVNPNKIVEDFSNYQARRVETYGEAIQARVDLKKRLGDLARMIWEESGKPLVLIIDDLDRCRPDFAVALLERIKHLFNVRYVVFVLGIDLMQFISALVNIYGEKFDSSNYIHRLIDFELSLPPPTYDTYADMLIQQFGLWDYLRNSFGSDRNYVIGVVREFKEVVGSLGKAYSLSLREMERLVREIVIIERLHPVKSEVDSTLIAVMICLRIRAQDVYTKFINDELAPKDLVDFVLKNEGAFGKTAAFHISLVIYAASRNSKHSQSIGELAQSANNDALRKLKAPNIYATDSQSLSYIAERASSLTVTYERVGQIDKALRHLENWLDPTW